MLTRSLTPLLCLPLVSPLPFLPALWFFPLPPCTDTYGSILPCYGTFIRFVLNIWFVSFCTTGWQQPGRAGLIHHGSLRARHLPRTVLRAVLRARITSLQRAAYPVRMPGTLGLSVLLYSCGVHCARFRALTIPLLPAAIPFFSSILLCLCSILASHLLRCAPDRHLCSTIMAFSFSAL